MQGPLLATTQHSTSIYTRTYMQGSLLDTAFHKHIYTHTYAGSVT